MDAGVPRPGLCDRLQERHLRAGDRGPDLSGRQGVGRHLPVSSTTHQEDTTTPLDTCQVPVPSTSISSTTTRRIPPFLWTVDTGHVSGTSTIRFNGKNTCPFCVLLTKLLLSLVFHDWSCLNNN